MPAACPRCARPADGLCPACAGCRTALELNEAILEAASTAASLDAFRDAALFLTREALDAEIGVFATMRDGAIRRSVVGFDPALMPRLVSRWSVYGREVAVVDAEARQRGSATDRRMLGSALDRTHVYRELMAPSGGDESLIVGLEFGGRRLGLFMIARSGRRRFSDAEVALAGSVGKTLSVSCAALESPNPRAAPSALNETDAELLRYLELGHATRDIAIARGTSFYTVRNQLSALYRKLGVANRTEAVGLRAWR